MPTSVESARGRVAELEGQRDAILRLMDKVSNTLPMAAFSRNSNVLEEQGNAIEEQLEQARADLARLTLEARVAAVEGEVQRIWRRIECRGPYEGGRNGD